MILLAVLAAGCTSKPDAEDAARVVETFQYSKAKNGICFGVSNTINSSGALNTIAVVVPCAQVGL